MFFWKFYEISKNTFSYRTPLLVVSGMSKCFWESFVENAKAFSSLHPEMEIVIHPPSKDEELRNIGDSINMVLDAKKSIFGCQQRLQFYIYFIMTTYYKMQQRLLQNATVVLTENGTKIYYKMRQVFLKKCDSFAKKCNSLITKCSSHYKMRWCIH